MPKDRFPVYLWITAITSAASPLAYAYFGIWATIVVWTISAIATAVCVKAFWNDPLEVPYPSMVHVIEHAAPAPIAEDLEPMEGLFVPPASRQPDEPDLFPVPAATLPERQLSA